MRPRGTGLRGLVNGVGVSGSSAWQVLKSPPAPPQTPQRPHSRGRPCPPARPAQRLTSRPRPPAGPGAGRLRCPAVVPGASGPSSAGAPAAAVRGRPVLSGGRPAPRAASPWKVCAPERRNPRLLGGAQARPPQPQVCRAARAGGAAQRPGPAGGATAAGVGARVPRLLRVAAMGLSAAPLAPLGSLSPSPSCWAVDNPHTRKSCLLGPADCSSPPPPSSPLPPLPPPSLPPRAPGQLARSQACHRRRPAGSARRRRCRSRGPDPAPLTPHLLGPSSAVPRRERLRRAGRREEPAERQGFPYL